MDNLISILSHLSINKTTNSTGKYTSEALNTISENINKLSSSLENTFENNVNFRKKAEFTILGKLISHIETKTFNSMILVINFIKYYFIKILKTIKLITIKNFKYPHKVASTLALIALLIFIYKRLSINIRKIKYYSIESKFLRKSNYISNTMKLFFYNNFSSHDISDNIGDTVIRSKHSNLKHNLDNYYLKFDITKNEERKYHVNIYNYNNNLSLSKIISMNNLLNGKYNSDLKLMKEYYNNRVCIYKKPKDVYYCDNTNNNRLVSFHKIFWAYVSNIDNRKYKNRSIHASANKKNNNTK